MPTFSKDGDESINAPLGIAFKVGSVMAYTVMGAFIKAAGTLPAGQIVFYRSFFALIPILVYLAVTGTLRSAMQTQNPWGHAGRALAGVFAMGFYFYGITRIPLPEATALNYALPLFLVILSALVLREQVRLMRWSAVLVGLVGVWIVFAPRFTIFSEGLSVALADQAATGALAMLIGAFLAAFAMIFVRTLTKTESSQTIVLYFSLASVLVSLMSLPFGWDALDMRQIMLLVTVGVLGGVGQILMTQGYRYAQASVLAPFEYSSLIVAIAIGYVFFGEIVTVSTLVGGVLVILAGLFIIWRERKLGLKRAAARRVSTPL